MRFLGIGDAADLASLYLRLAEEGHDIKICIGNPLCRDTLAGSDNPSRKLAVGTYWVREAGPEGCILFEKSARGGENFRIV